MQIGRSGDSYFSLEAIIHSPSGDVSSKSLMERVLLSLEKQCEIAVSSRRIASAKEFLIPEEWVSGIVQRLKSTTPAAVRTEEAALSIETRVLERFLLDLRDSSKTPEALKASFLALGEPFKTILCNWIWHAAGEPQGDPQYGEHRILEDPRCLLAFVDGKGNTIVERLIELWQGVSDRRFEQVITMCNLETFSKRESTLFDASFKKAFYEAIATRYGAMELAEIIVQMRSIDDPDLRFAIAKSCAQRDGCGTAEHIQNFRIIDEGRRYELAKLCAEQNAGWTALRIQNFKIDDQDRLYEIARFCAEQNARWITYYIQNFGISNPEYLYEIAKLCAQRDGGGVTARNIQNFGISDPVYLYEIAKLCAEQNAGWTALCIQNFKIDDQDRLYEIARFCAEQHVGWTAKHIGNFKIIDEGRRYELAKLCAQHDGGGIAEYIQNFEITDSDRLYEIAKICVLNAGRTVFALIDNKFSSLFLDKKENLKNLSVWSMIAFQDLSEEGKKHFVMEIFPSVRAALGEEKHRFLLDAFSEEEKVAMENEVPDTFRPQLMMKLCGIRCLLDVSKGEPIAEVMQKTCIAALIYRNPQISKAYLLEIFSYMQEERGLAIYVSCVTGRIEPVEYLRLPMLMIAKWLAKSDHSPKMQEALKNIKSCVLKERTAFRNAKVPLMQMWLSTCLALEKQPEFTAEDKVRLLDWVASDLDKKQSAKDLEKRLSCVKALLSMGQEKALVTAPSLTINATSHLSSLIEGILATDPYLGLGSVEDLSDKYLRTLGSMRVPMAWGTYASQIKQTGDADVQKAFQHALIHILEGTHREARYAEESSPHIQKIVEGHKEVWDRWKAPVEEQRIELGSSEKRDVFSFQNYLKTKCDDGHFLFADGRSLDLLTSVIQNPSIAEAKQLECQEMAAKSRDSLLQAQDLLISLYRNNASAEDLLAKKQEIEAILTTLAECELASDLQGLLTELSRSQQEQGQGLTLVDTDDWQDLLLCGTEVTGSCQRVEGSQNLNKCLLAYVIDGKNRMLAIKDFSGKIQARALFRMLWDPERQEPVLFLDRIYPSPCPPTYTEALNNLAKERARSLGLRLYVQGSDRGVSIESLGSRAPWEYEDAALGVQQNGVFTVHNAQEVSF